MMFGDRGRSLYMFVSWHTLVITENIMSFIDFQLQLLALIQQHPFHLHVKIYIYGLELFTADILDIFYTRSTDIAIKALEMIKSNNIKNPYVCLFLSFLLRFPISDKVRYKIVIQICKWVDLVSLKVRVRVMENLFNFLYKNNSFLIFKKSKGRKMVMFANYLTIICSFKGFLKRFNWKKLENEDRENRRLFMKKRKFYDKMK